MACVLEPWLWFHTECTEQLKQTMTDLQNQLGTQAADAETAISMWEEECNDLRKQLDLFVQDRKMYEDMQEEVEKLRIHNASLEGSIQAALQTLQDKEEELDRHEQNLAQVRSMSETRYRQMVNEKEIVITQLNQEVIDMKTKSEDAAMQWKGQCKSIQVSYKCTSMLRC